MARIRRERLVLGGLLAVVSLVAYAWLPPSSAGATTSPKPVPNEDDRPPASAGATRSTMGNRRALQGGRRTGCCRNPCMRGWYPVQRG